MYKELIDDSSRLGRQEVCVGQFPGLVTADLSRTGHFLLILSIAFGVYLAGSAWVALMLSAPDFCGRKRGLRAEDKLRFKAFSDMARRVLWDKAKF